MLLDLSVAFDTMEYDILVGPLVNILGIRAVVLQWINSCVRSHTEAIPIMDAISVLCQKQIDMHISSCILGLVLSSNKMQDKF